jgi:uncharacterized membrane protein YhaH (DUF805 family)
MDTSPNPIPETASRGTTLIAAGLLLAALALVVLYTGRGAFLSPLALVVIAAIGVVALILQVRLRPSLSNSATAPARSPLWLNALGVLFAVAAVIADRLHGEGAFMIAALAAVVSFAVSGIIVLSFLRKRRI